MSVQFYSPPTHVTVRQRVLLIAIRRALIAIIKAVEVYLRQERPDELRPVLIAVHEHLPAIVAAIEVVLE